MMSSESCYKRNDSSRNEITNLHHLTEERAKFAPKGSNVQDQNKIKMGKRVKKMKDSLNINTNVIEDAWKRLQKNLDAELKV